MKAFRKYIHDLAEIEEEFADIDKENKATVFHMRYKSPSEILDPHAAEKTPELTEDFYYAIEKVFDRIPDRYTVSFDVAFDDLEGRSEEELADICYKNLLLKAKNYRQENKKRNCNALYILASSLVFAALAIMLGIVWSDGGFWKQLVRFVLEIVATVPVYCAAEVFLIDNKMNRRGVKNLAKRFKGIHLHAAE